MDVLFNSIVSGIASILARVLPDSAGLPSSVSGAFTYLINGLYGVSLIIPATTILQVTAATVAFEFIMLIWWGVRFLLNLFRGSGG